MGAVTAAILAANPPNTQPWFFPVTDTSLDLYADPMPTVDPFLREQHVGLGCVLKSLVTGCRARGRSRPSSCSRTPWTRRAWHA